VHAAACFNAAIHTVTLAAHAWASKNNSHSSGASCNKQGQHVMQKQSRATADKNRKEKKTGKEKKRKERKEKKRKEKKRKEKKRKEKKRKEKKRKEKKAKKRKENKEKKRQNSMLHLKVKVFWQAKAYGQAAHDVHSNSVHLVHESQHSFSAHAMQGYGTCKSEMQTMLSSCIKD